MTENSVLIQEVFKYRNFSNIIFHIGWMVGIGSGGYIYALEYFARINCPLEVNIKS